MPFLLAGAAALAGLVVMGAAGAGSSPPVAQAPATAPDRALLEAFAGEYGANTFVMTVTHHRDGTLTLLFPGQPLYSLDHESGTRYRIRELKPGFGVEFMRDAEGRVTGVTVRQPPPQQDFVAPRKGGPQPASAGTTARGVPATPPARPGVAPSSPSVTGPPPATPAPAPAAVEASGAAPAGFQRITLLEGASFDVPAGWKATVVPEPRIGDTESFSAGPLALSSSVTRALRKSFREDPQASLHAFVRKRYAIMRVVDVDVPGGKAVEVRNPEHTGESTGLYLGVDVSGTRWWFTCFTMSADEQRMCTNVIRSIRVRPGAADPIWPTRPAAAATPANRPPSSINSTTAPLVAEWSKDPRLASLKAEDREYALEEAAGHVIACSTNVTLGNFYECPCLGSRMLDARLATGFERIVFRQQLVLKVDAAALAFDVYTTKGGRDVTRCIAPDKIRKYGVTRAHELLASQPEATRTRVAECTGNALTESYRAKPIPSISLINDMFTNAVISCRRTSR